MYMRFPPQGYREKIWDHAAGVVIVTEAGGKVCLLCNTGLALLHTPVFRAIYIHKDDDIPKIMWVHYCGSMCTCV